jgi:signal transduction histidine kinase
VRDQLFEPFFTTKAKLGGTGLGLAVVRTLVVDVLHGTVHVDDAPGGGARFVVELPALAAPPALPSREAVDASVVV